MPLRPCGVCRIPCPDGQCPDHRYIHRARRRPKAKRHHGNRWTAVRAAAFARDERTCQYCGDPATTGDLVVPFALGGTETVDNTVAACAWCNNSKGGRSLADWIASGLAPDGAAEFLRKRTQS